MKELRVSCFLLFLIVIFIVASPLLIPGALGQNTARLAPSDDSWVEYEYPNTNHGLETVLRVKSDSRIRRSYLKFDLSSIPAGKVIASVKLYLYCTATDLNPSVGINAYETGDSWSQGSITWNNAPAVGTLIANTTVGGTGQYYSWGITSYCVAQYQGDKILSVVVKFPLDDPIQNNPNYARDFASKEYSGTLQDPYLEVTYDNSPPTAYFVHSPTYPVANDTVTFNASSSYDPDGYIASYTWDFGDGNITTVTDSIITHAYSTYANYTVTLTVTDNDGLTDSYIEVVEVVDPAILRVSLPEGTYVKQIPPTGDPWIDEGWLLNQTGNSWSITLKIYDTSKCLKSSDTHLIVALNDAAYYNLQSLTINGTSIPQTAFKNGKPKPYGTKDWPNCVYSTWFNDTYINVGLIPPKGSKILTVSVTFTDATNARIHFDAYGSVFDWKPCGWCQVTWSPHSEDSTVMFSAPEEQYYLTVKTDPADIITIPGEGWYAKSTDVVLTAPSVVSGSPGVHYRFDYWDVDGASQGIGVNPITVHMDANHTATAHYVVQYRVTFDQTGLSSDATVTVVTVDGEPYTFDDLPLTMWVDSGSTVTYSYNSLVSSSISGKRFSLIDVTGPSSPITVTNSVTVIGNYKVQYEVVFNQSGVGTDFTGTVVIIDGTGYGVTGLPVSFWWDKDSSHSFSFASPLVVNAGKQYVWVSTSGLSTLQSGTLTVTTSGNVVGNYTTEVKYEITFDQTGVGSDFTSTVVTIDGTNYNVGSLPVSFWWDAGSVHNFIFQSPLLVTPNAKQYVWNSTSGLSTLRDGSIAVTTSGNVIGNYKTQYYLIVKTNPGEVLTLNPAAVSGQGWYYSESTATVDAVQNVDKVAGQSRYDFRSWTGATSTGVGNKATVFMDGPKTATANYKLQYKISFNQSGVGSDFSGTVVIIDGTNYGVVSPPILAVSFWWDVDSIHSFDFKSPLLVTPNAKQYVWTSTTGLSSLQSGSITVSASGSIIGNYKTQCYLTVKSDYDSPTPTSGWFDAGKSITASVTSPWLGPTGIRYVCTRWTGTGSVPASGTASSVTFVINEPSSITWNWKTQYYLTVRTSPSGIVTIPGEGWYDPSVIVSLTAPSVAGYNFVNWDVDGVSQGAGVTSISITMNVPHTATAHYAPIQLPPTVPVGGYSISLTKPTPTSLIVAYTMLIALFSATISLIRRKRKY